MCVCVLTQNRKLSANNKQRRHFTASCRVIPPCCSALGLPWQHLHLVTHCQCPGSSSGYTRQVFDSTSCSARGHTLWIKTAQKLETLLLLRGGTRDKWKRSADTAVGGVWGWRDPLRWNVPAPLRVTKANVFPLRQCPSDPTSVSIRSTIYLINKSFLLLTHNKQQQLQEHVQKTTCPMSHQLCSAFKRLLVP